MNNLKYNCLKCGTCCHEIDSEYKKRIPLYPDEVDSLIIKAEERSVPLRVIEDLVFPDVLNKQILVVTYKFDLNNASKGCPFYSNDIGCTVHQMKPLACQAYPLALKQIDAFNFQISIDPLCNFVLKYYDQLKNADLELLKSIFYKEYPKAIAHLNKNKKIMLKIKKLEYSNKIKIARQISIEDFNRYLKDWERQEIKVRPKEE
ncbi:MAG: YkgJ family cysteine cluster protein [Candidatus Hodarchaeota archaeon]